MPHTTQALFDELAELAALPGTPAVLWADTEPRARRPQLAARPDLAQVLRRVLVEESAPPPGSPVLDQHRAVVRTDLAVAFVAAVAPDVAFALLADARAGTHVLGPAVYALLERAPELWPRALEPQALDLAIVRWALARLEKDAARAGTLVPSLVRLARLGTAADYVYALLVREGSEAALAAVSAAANDGALAGDVRAVALAVHPEATTIARALVASRTHATSWSLVRTVLRSLETGGLDQAFRAGDGERSFATFEELGAAIERWVEAEPEAIDVGLVPMHRGLMGGGHQGFTLAPSRDQQLVVDGVPVWAIRYSHVDDREDPNQLSRVRTLGAGPPIAFDRLRVGPHLDATITLTVARREAGDAHPFASAWAFDENGETDETSAAVELTLEAPWWHSALPGVEVALLPLRDAGGDDDDRVTAFAWLMPGSRAGSAYLYAVVLSGESLLDAHARSGKPVTIACKLPVTTAAQRHLLEALLAPEMRA